MAGNGWCRSDLKIVLLGGRNSGKSALGNLILGEEAFVTKERTTCSHRMRLLAGRWLTVVDTPGWWCDFSVGDTPALLRREIISSVSLCSPGPHVFLLIIKAGSEFTERRRRAAEEHVALLGPEAWRHCLLVFTFRDKSAHTKAEEYVGKGGQWLQWLSEKCGRRCHSVALDDEAEAVRLLLVIRELVRDNEDRVYEEQEGVFETAVEEKRRVEERAELRLMRVKRQRSLMRKTLRPVTDIRIVLLGAKGCGKTSAMNTILGRRSSECLRRTARCHVGETVMFGRNVTVVDTPGWRMNSFCEQSSIFDRREMVLSLSLCPPGPHVFLLVVRVDRAFTETFRKAAQEHLELISEHIWSHVIVLFSFGDWLGATTAEHYAESEGQSLLWLVETCGNRYHVLDNKTKGDGFQVRELIGKIEELMTCCNVCWHYELEKSGKEQLERSMSREREQADERLRRKTHQSQTAKSNLVTLPPLPKLEVVLVGGRRTGKSSCGNTILGRESFVTGAATTSCAEGRTQIGNQTVAVMDTPGCFCVTSDLLTESCAVLVVVNLSASFNESQWAALEEQLTAGGSGLWNRAVVVFSYGDCLGDTTIEQHIESEGAPLHRLVERCGNRYHVLDNKQQGGVGGGRGVMELIQLVEEMLGEHRKSRRDTEDDVDEEVPSAGERPPGTVKQWEKDSNRITEKHQVPHDRPETCNVTQSSCETSVAVRRRRNRRRNGYTFMDGDRFLPSIAALLGADCRPLWTDFHQRVRLTLQWQSGSNPEVWLPPHTQHRMVTEEVGVHTPSDGLIRERTLRRLRMSGGLQTFIDQWGNSSLEELEAFIDSYFEMVWEQSMETPPTSPQDAANREDDGSDREEILTSINRKLTKLELLEEIRRHMCELSLSLDQCCRTLQERRDESSTATEERQTRTL